MESTNSPKLHVTVGTDTMKLQDTPGALRSLAETVVLLACATLIGAAAYKWGRSSISADVYRQRAAELARHCNDLRSAYNEAVRRTAVTELLVRDGAVSVVVRTAEGVLRTIPVDVDPETEIYVDYVLMDGRIWIRRVFDERTPPNKATIIDPTLAHVDWPTRDESSFGKAVYRQLSEGRWSITVSGNGALGLSRVEGSAVAELHPPPAVAPFPELMAETETRATAVGPGDVWKWVLGKWFGKTGDGRPEKEQQGQGHVES